MLHIFLSVFILRLCTSSLLAERYEWDGMPSMRAREKDKVHYDLLSVT